MPQSLNYIKVKSRRQLKQENDDAQLIIRKAGTNDGMPGGTNMPVGRVFSTGVCMPQSFEEVGYPGGGPLTSTDKHSWTPSAGIGRGSVDGPELITREVLTDQHTYSPYPWFDARLRRLVNLYDPQQVFQKQSNTLDHTNDNMPADVYRSGATPPERSQGSVGKDNNRTERVRKEKLNRTRRGPR